MNGALREPAFLRFAQGTYSFPFTWWIGVFQISMLGGAWGVRHQSAARTRQQVLARILYQWSSDPKRNERTSYVATFIRSHFKAYLVGRGIGGVFTSYAQTGGARLPLRVALPQSATNFTMASFGGGVLAVGKGARSVENILFSTITGRAGSVPRMPDSANIQVDDQDPELQAIIANARAVREINRISPVGPISIEEFCGQRRNASLQGTSVCP